MKLKKIEIGYRCKHCKEASITSYYSIDIDIMAVSEEIEDRACSHCHKHPMVVDHIKCILKDDPFKQHKKAYEKSLDQEDLFLITYQCVRCGKKWVDRKRLNQDQLFIHNVHGVSVDQPGATRNVKCTSPLCSSLFSRIIGMIPL